VVTAQRYLSIDILRGSAIVLMIQVHFIENLSAPDPDTSWLYYTAQVLGAIPAPLFAFVSGVSYALWVQKQQAEKHRDEEITKISVRRGLFLFLLGIAFNFLVWLPEDTFNWDILTLLGSALLFLAPGRKLPLPVLVVLCVLILAIAPVFRAVGDYPQYWEDGSYTYDFTFTDVLFGFFANGYFPIFPWLIFPLLGFVVGELLFREEATNNTLLWWLGTVSVSLLVFACLGVLLFGGLSEFPASTTYVLATAGFTLLGFTLLHRWVDRSTELNAEGFLLRSIRRYSNFSLTVYVLHHIVILWPLWIYGAATGADDVTVFWRHAMTTPLALCCFLAFMVPCHLLLIVLEKHKRWALETWMRRLCG